jgi:hypothetical protein
MSWIVSHIKWIMLLAGALTSTMLHAAIAPQAALGSMFGETLEGPVAEIIVRSWGVLIALVGLMLIYGAFDRPSRPLILSIAGLSKLIFIALVLALGRPYLDHQVGVAVVIDSIMVVLFIGYLLGARSKTAA